MKLLFDENLSFRLVVALADIYPGSEHVCDIGLLGADDLSAKTTSHIVLSQCYTAANVAT